MNQILVRKRLFQCALVLLTLLSIAWGIFLYVNPSYEAIALVALGKAVPKFNFALLTGPDQGCVFPPSSRIEGQAEKTLSKYIRNQVTPAAIFRQKLSTMFRKFKVSFSMMEPKPSNYGSAVTVRSSAYES